MSTTTVAPTSAPRGVFKRFLFPALSRRAPHVFTGAAILLLDLFTGKFLLFPILFIVPVTLSAWFCSSRLSFSLAFLLPVGRLLIATFVDTPAPFPFIVANCLIRIAVLVFIAFLVSRTARQTRELQLRVDTLVTICAWSRTVEYQGEWLSIEEYLTRRFKIHTTHGISPTEVKKVFDRFEKDRPNS